MARLLDRQALGCRTAALRKDRATGGDLFRVKRLRGDIGALAHWL
jgi:hypothetical protein